VKNKTGLMVPPSVRRRAGIKPCDRLEFKVSGGIINIIPRLPTADDEYTPEQRRIIDAGIAEGMEDFRKGRSHGPFTAGEAVNFLKSQMTRPQTKSVKRAK
jgi:bifunctional DNA-binding transcriptional regulator/antitoxin component of YhaV-PrlF toxin-antitoxin module